MKEVNADLYEILRSNEVRLNLENGEVIAHVFIYLCDLKDFVEAVGEAWFTDNEKKIVLRGAYVAIEINDIIEAEGHLLSSYENCFDPCDWADYKEKIMAMEC